MALLVSRGPWTGADVDGEYAASIKWMSGEVIEFVCLDGSKHDQGKGLLVVLSAGGKARVYRCRYLRSEDPYYSWWATNSGELRNPGLYRCAANKGDDWESTFRGELVVPIRKWRVLGSVFAPPVTLKLGWLSGDAERALKDELEAIRVDLDKNQSPVPPPWQCHLLSGS